MHTSHWNIWKIKCATIVHIIRISVISISGRMVTCRGWLQMLAVDLQRFAITFVFTWVVGCVWLQPSCRSTGSLNSVVLVWVILHDPCTFCLSVPLDGLSLVNEDGDLRVFFPRNSFVTNTTLTHTNSPRMAGGATGNDHIVCYSDSLPAGLGQVPWYNNGGARQLLPCIIPCGDCGGRCVGNGGVGVDPPLSGLTDIHMYTDSSGYVNQDLECQAPNGLSAFIGVYLESGGEMVLWHISGNKWLQQCKHTVCCRCVHWIFRNLQRKCYMVVTNT